MPKGIKKIAPEEPVDIGEGVEIATPEVKEPEGLITLVAKGGVNNIPAGYTRTFDNKADADAWAKVYC